jgi:hypothetical protein
MLSYLLSLVYIYVISPEMYNILYNSVQFY